MQGRKANGEPIEEHGTTPDVLVETAPADRAAKRDVQLAKALELVGAGAQAADLAAGVLRAHGAIWTQSLQEAPTVTEAKLLRRALQD